MKWLLMGSLLCLSIACSGPNSPQPTESVARKPLGIAGKPRGADLYTFERKQFDLERVTIHVIKHPSQPHLLASYQKQTGIKLAPGWKLKGYAFPNPNGYCELHIVDPAVNYEPEFAGHEFLHCVYGEFHPNQGP